MAGVCEDIEKLMNGFWWGRGSNEKGIMWLPWEKISIPKSAGELGLKRLHNFNVAMLANWARYFPGTNFLNVELGINPSYVCRSILAAKDAVKVDYRRRIENGSMDMDGHNWDFKVLYDICNDRDIELIRRIPIPAVDKEDS
ncbi:putative mitochondrial protein AtMg00310 [Apium graveolens]|uniref:putative mitochondrial protein AtMg00310 n=1 Tax=Apium graveolens TaxID=4045 RepID=UPI003D7B8B54